MKLDITSLKNGNNKIVLAWISEFSLKECDFDIEIKPVIAKRTRKNKCEVTRGVFFSLKEVVLREIYSKIGHHIKDVFSTFGGYEYRGDIETAIKTNALESLIKDTYTLRCFYTEYVSFTHRTSAKACAKKLVTAYQDLIALDHLAEFRHEILSKNKLIANKAERMNVDFSEQVIKSLENKKAEGWVESNNDELKALSTEIDEIEKKLTEKKALFTEQYNKVLPTLLEKAHWEFGAITLPKAVQEKLKAKGLEGGFQPVKTSHSLFIH